VTVKPKSITTNPFNHAGLGGLLMTEWALRMILLTLVRKSELIQATWDEVDFETATWTIPKQRMKGRNPHVVYLSRQALDIFVALHTCAAPSSYCRRATTPTAAWRTRL
jgi:integrase